MSLFAGIIANSVYFAATRNELSQFANDDQFHIEFFT